MSPRITKARRLRLGVAVLAVLLLTLAVAPVALAEGPITWVPGTSTYGVVGTPFSALGYPAPPGMGATSPIPGPGVAYGAGFWDATSEVYVVGFMGQLPTSVGLPTISQTDLSLTPLVAGTALELEFTKLAGQRIDSIAMLADPGALIEVEPADSAALTAATQFTVYASVADPVLSASGDAGAAFGMVIDCSSLPARDYQASVFVTNMHWLDIDPPTVTTSGVAGLSASGVNGVEATFDGIFAPAFLTAMGVTDPTQVQGYVDVTAVTGWANAAFSQLGAGDGSLWPAGFYRYRITNSTWSTHNIMFGKLTAPLAKPAKPVSVSPKGLITGTRPTFRWKTATGAKTYEVRVYRGTRLLLKKVGATSLYWRASKALPRGVYLTWRVRGSNTAGLGLWSTTLRFKIR